jgi:G3E family GTPase
LAAKTIVRSELISTEAAGQLGASAAEMFRGCVSCIRSDLDVCGVAVDLDVRPGIVRVVIEVDLSASPLEVTCSELLAHMPSEHRLEVFAVEMVVVPIHCSTKVDQAANVLVRQLRNSEERVFIDPRPTFKDVGAGQKPVGRRF